MSVLRKGPWRAALRLAAEWCEADAAECRRRAAIDLRCESIDPRTLVDAATMMLIAAQLEGRAKAARTEAES